MALIDSYDVSTASAPTNLTREQVAQRITDLSWRDTPFMGMIGRDSHTNQFFEWSCDRLAEPDTSNRVIDGSTAPTPAVRAAIRLGNNGQISQKTVSTSTRLEASNNVGNESLQRQITMRTEELQRDMEAMLLENIANQQDTGNGGVEGITAGLEAWLDAAVADAGGADKSPLPFADASGELTLSTALGGWSKRTGTVLDTVDYGALTTAGAGSFQDLKDVLNALWQLNVKATKIMSRPKVIEGLSAFMFTSSAQIATLVRDRNEMGAAQAQASVNQMISDHGVVVDFVPNVFQQLSGDGSPDCSTLFALDPMYLSLSWQGGGLRTKELPASGLFRSVQIHGDYGLCVKNPDAIGAILCINEDLAWTA